MGDGQPQTPGVILKTVRLDEKARENLEAADRLLSTEVELPLHNAAASRAYYAAYQAVADRAQRIGIAFTGQTDYYRHDSFPTLARELIDNDQSDELRLLHGLRIKDDYMEDQVDLDESSLAAETARRIVEALLGAS
jgi:CelD/BcsL family acetyltransferase involved in cellulose biosynthesis